MKRIFLSAFCLLVTGIASHAQTTNVDSSYTAYVGKYLFAPGKPVEEVDIYIKDTSLVVKSESTGSIILKKLGIDSFAVNAAGADSVVFKRDAANNVNKLLLYTFSGRAVPAEKQKPEAKKKKANNKQ